MEQPYIAYYNLEWHIFSRPYGDYYSSEETLMEALPYIKNDLQYQMAANNLFNCSKRKKKLR
jgi:hypothetical protein